MENTSQPEQELEKGGETQSQAASNQSSEAETGAQKDDLKDPVKKLQDELTEAKDKYLRLYAEFDNHRRRTSKERMEMIQSANADLVKSLLPVLDDFDRAGKSFSERNDKEAEGFFLIQNKFKKILEQYGVKPMVVAAASEFNPDLHEAITQIPAPDEKLKGKIVDVIEPGYLLNDKVIRFAKVVIGN